MQELQDLAEPLSMARLAPRARLVAAVQARLAHHGLLDPPGDGVLDPATQWALFAFCGAAALPFGGELTPDAARALLTPAPILPLHAAEDLAGRIARALVRRGDWLCRHPACVNIVYVEGMDETGRAIPRRPDAFDDLRLLLRVDAEGRPVIVGQWQATTASGRPAVEEPAEPEGAPRLLSGQHRAWVIGRTAIGTELEQEALVQVAPLRVTRDTDRDFHRAGDMRDRDLFLIDQHGGLDAPREEIGGVGAGCLVGRVQAGHAAFMAMLREDARWRATSAHRFTTSVIAAAEL